MKKTAWADMMKAPQHIICREPETPRLIHHLMFFDTGKAISGRNGTSVRGRQGLPSRGRGMNSPEQLLKDSAEEAVPKKKDRKYGEGKALCCRRRERTLRQGQTKHAAGVVIAGCIRNGRFQARTGCSEKTHGCSEVGGEDADGRTSGSISRREDTKELSGSGDGTCP